MINYSSICALTPSPNMPLYNSSKGFIKTFSNSLTLDYAAQGIDVMAIMPLAVKSQMNTGGYLGTISAQDHAKSVID